MFSGMLNWNLRLRLTVMLTLSVSAALAIVFSVVLVVLREQALERRYTELERSVQRIAHEWSGPTALVEEHEDFPEVDFTVSKPDGSVLASTSKTPVPFSVGRAKVEHRLFFGSSNGKISVIGTASWSETEAGLRLLALVLMGLWLPLAILTAGIAWYGGGLVLRPVTELVRSADKLSSASAKDLLETTDHAEFAALAESLNKMIERVRRSAEVQEQFASDAAHELRSPLALLRTRIETTLLNDRTGEEYQSDLRSLLPKVDRLTSIVETLLSSARDGQGSVPSLDLHVSLNQIVSQWVLDANWDQDRLKINMVPCQAEITFEELRIVACNFLDNAASHSPKVTPLVVTLVQLDEVVRLGVRDFGPGLSDEGRSQAFERFYRSEEDRNRETGGAGIGLAVVKRIVESRHGQVGFCEVESGAEAYMTLPISANNI